MPAESDVLQWWDRSLTREELADHTVDSLSEELRERLVFEARVCAAVAQWKRRLGQVSGEALARDKKSARRYGHTLATTVVACGWFESSAEWHDLKATTREDAAVMQAGAVLVWDEWRMNLIRYLEAQLVTHSGYVIHHAVGNEKLRTQVTAMARLREQLMA